MNKSKIKLKGSAVVLVILSAITFTIYSSSTYSQQEHFNLMQKRYEKRIINYYERDLESIDEIYEELVEINLNIKED